MVKMPWKCQNKRLLSVCCVSFSICHVHSSASALVKFNRGDFKLVMQHHSSCILRVTILNETLQQWAIFWHRFENYQIRFDDDPEKRFCNDFVHFVPRVVQCERLRTKLLTLTKRLVTRQEIAELNFKCGHTFAPFLLALFTDCARIGKQITQSVKCYLSPVRTVRAHISLTRNEQLGFIHLYTNCCVCPENNFLTFGTKYLNKMLCIWYQCNEYSGFYSLCFHEVTIKDKVPQCNGL